MPGLRGLEIDQRSGGTKTRRRGLAPTLAWAALTLCAAPVAGQLGELHLLQTGDSLRLRVSGALRMNASLLSTRGDTLLLDVAGLDAAWPVSGRDLASLERFTERTPREGFRHGAVIGMVSGLFAGVAIGVALNLGGRSDDEDVEASAAFLNGALKWSGLGFALGGLGGGFVGGAYPGRGWVGIELPAR